MLIKVLGAQRKDESLQLFKPKTEKLSLTSHFFLFFTSKSISNYISWPYLQNISRIQSLPSSPWSKPTLSFLDEWKKTLVLLLQLFPLNSLFSTEQLKVWQESDRVTYLLKTLQWFPSHPELKSKASQGPLWASFLLSSLSSFPTSLRHGPTNLPCCYFLF